MHNSGIKKNVLYSVGYQILVIILPLLTTPYISRCLGADQLGVYSKTQAIANYFYLFTLLGLNNYGNRAIARIRDNENKTSSTFWEIYIGQLCVSIISFLVYIVFCHFGNVNNREIYFIQALYVASGIIEINWFCFGLEEFRLTMIRSTIVRLAVFVSIFVFVHNKNDLKIYTLIMASSYLISNIILWPYMLKHTRFIAPSISAILKHFKPNLLLFLPVISVSLYNIMDKIIMGIFSSNEELAFYTCAETIVNLPVTLIVALNNVIMPRMSNIFAKNEKDTANRLMNAVMLFTMFMSSAMAFGVAGVSNVFAPWFYGTEFTKCGLFILLLSPTILFRGWAGALRTQYIIPSGKDRVFVISLISGAIINVIIDIVLIPKMNGIGAIIGTLAAELSVAIIQFALCRKCLPMKQYIKNGFSFLFIGLVMFLCVEAVSKLDLSPFETLLIQTVIGISVYGLLGVLYMIITKQPILIEEGLKLLKIKDKK